MFRKETLLVSGEHSLLYIFWKLLTNLSHQRLILYFPVSALVTLFANILQNPQDPRARADVKLMNLVVNFLSMLVSDEENGSVKRMLGICTEFERIAKVVLDKTEKDSHSRRKRKPAADDPIMETLAAQVNGQGTPAKPMDAQTMSMASAAFTPGMGGMQNPLFSPSMMNANVYSPPQMMTGPPMMPGYDANFNGMMTPPGGLGNGIMDGDNSSNMASPMNFGSFQQPFVPQDLWQMPMTLEWDWADMTNAGFPGYEHPSDGIDGGMAPR